jgi:squalene-hopene/tetraprenyl-beta-curcumene cyclase
VTTLSINALAVAGELGSLDRREELQDWLLAQQYKERHVYTGAAPGGWAWTDLPGGVPDADDTPGAMLALHHISASKGCVTEDVKQATDAAYVWLACLWNRDRGWPTFCRGWGHLPFDRSGADLTAHVIRAFQSWGPSLRKIYPVGPWYLGATELSLEYLRSQQRRDGSWLPLWFGNQHAPNDENPTYGTARVLAAYRDLQLMDSEPAKRGFAFFLAIQNPDGGWGGAANTPSSIEETALAVEVLLDAGPEAEACVQKGLIWLIERIEAGGLHDPTPIGFYFAKLWYFEKLYPIIFSVAALGRALRRASRRPPASPP